MAATVRDMTSNRTSASAFAHVVSLAVAALSAIALVCAVSCSDGASAPVSQGLVIRNGHPERPYFYDFGRLAFGKRAEHVFEIENTDPIPVTIHDLQSVCGCTVARVAYTAPDGSEVEGAIGGEGPILTIPSGTHARISVRVDTMLVGRMNIDKLTQVRVRSDSLVTPYIDLELHLIVERLFRSVPDKIDLGLVPQSTGKGGRADLSTETKGSPARILGLESVEGPFVVHVDPTEVGDETLWIMTLDAKADQPLGPLKGKVTVQTTGSDGIGAGLPFEVPVIGQVVPDVVLDPGVLIFARAPAGSAPRAEATLIVLVPGARVLVRSVVASGGEAERLRIESTAIDPDDSGRATKWTIALVAPEDARGKAFSGSVVIETDHPRVPTVRAVYSHSP